MEYCFDLDRRINDSVEGTQDSDGWLCLNEGMAVAIVLNDIAFDDCLFVDGFPQTADARERAEEALILTLIDQHAWAHWRNSMDVMRQGCAMILFQVSQ